MVGEIYLAKIFFTDLSKSKIRPILVIKKLDKEDVICLQISSKIKEDRIVITNNDLIEGRIKKESVVIVPKNFTLHKSTLIKYKRNQKNSDKYRNRKRHKHKRAC